MNFTEFIDIGTCPYCKKPMVLPVNYLTEHLQKENDFVKFVCSCSPDSERPLFLTIEPSFLGDKVVICNEINLPKNFTVVQVYSSIAWEVTYF